MIQSKIRYNFEDYYHTRTIPYHTVPYTRPYHTMPHDTITYRYVPLRTITYHCVPLRTVHYIHDICYIDDIPCHTISYHTIHCIPYNTIHILGRCSFFIHQVGIFLWAFAKYFAQMSHGFQSAIFWCLSESEDVRDTSTSNMLDTNVGY